MGQEERAGGLAGGAVLAAWITGFLALIGAAFGAVSMDWSAVGICLVAAAIAFAGVANAILRQ